MPRTERRKRKVSRKSSRKTETSKGKVYMPYKKKDNTDVKRRKKKSFFKPKKNRSKSNKRKWSKFGNLSFYIFLILLFLGLLYLSTLFITKTRDGDSNDNAEYE
jgi:hypothetical protein